jgi:EipB-like
MLKVARSWAAAVLGLALLLVAAGQARVHAGLEGVNFRPHRAIYDISFDHATPGSGVADMTGRMVYEMSGSHCDGFAQKMRFVTRMTNQEGMAQLNDLRTSSFEEIATHRLRFSSKQYENDKLSETSQGSAGPGNGATFTEVKLTKPAKKTVKLPSDIYFPIQHSLALMQAAQEGKSLFIANLYDGSDKGEKFYETSAVIGERAEPGSVPLSGKLSNAKALAGLASWPIAIAYFEPGPAHSDTVPSYELSFRFYENGVSTNLYIDYGEFAIRGELKELEFLEDKKCPAGKTR